MGRCPCVPLLVNFNHCINISVCPKLLPVLHYLTLTCILVQMASSIYTLTLSPFSHTCINLSPWKGRGRKLNIAGHTYIHVLVHTYIHHKSVSIVPNVLDVVYLSAPSLLPGVSVLCKQRRQGNVKRLFSNALVPRVLHMLTQ